MAVYNGEKSLHAAVDSILSQTFTDFEFIIINDCSTDGTRNILETYAIQDSRIRLLHNETNLRLPTSLNRGLSVARAPLIARMDDDDISLPERFAKQYAFMQANPRVDVCGTAFYIPEIEQARYNTGGNEAIRVSLLFGCELIHPSLVMRKSTLDAMGGYPVISPCEDYTLWVNMCLAPTRPVFANLQEVLILYSWGNYLQGDTPYTQGTNKVTWANRHRLLSEGLGISPTDADLFYHNILCGGVDTSQLTDTHRANLAQWCLCILQHNAQKQFFEQQALQEALVKRYPPLVQYITATAGEAVPAQEPDVRTTCSPEAWDAGYVKHVFQEAPANRHTDFLLNAIPRDHGRGFEVGAFPGHNIPLLSQLGYVMDGIDTAERLLELPAWLQSKGIHGGQFTQGDFFATTIDKRYRLVVSFGFVEHFVNWHEVVQKHCELVAPGGRLCITFPNFSGAIQQALHRWLDAPNLSRHYLPAMDAHKQAQLCEQNGFAILFAGYFGGFDFWVETAQSSQEEMDALRQTLALAEQGGSFPNLQIWSPYGGLVAIRSAKIAVLYICTGRYSLFWDAFYTSSEKHFLNRHEKQYFVFTDCEIPHTDKPHVHTIYQEKLGWPYDTLCRFHMFHSIHDKLREFDFVFFFNANCEFMQTIDETVLPDQEEGLIVTQHPGFFDKDRTEYSYDTNAGSLACVLPDEGVHYVSGGINGGTAKAYLELVCALKAAIDADTENGVIALWHDESHLNRYVINRPYRLLHPGYFTPQGVALPFPEMIRVRDKNTLGGHAFLRGQVDTPSLPVVAKLSCGLGNQMFQLAAAVALAARFQGQIAFDTSWFSLAGDHAARDFSLYNAFPATRGFSEVSAGLLADLPRFVHHGMDFMPDFDHLFSPVLLDGYWQSPQYFRHCESKIRSLFRFAPLTEQRAAHTAAIISSTPQATAVHIRRGDFIHLAHVHEKHGVLPMSYYRNAVAKLKSTGLDPHLFVFSDDPGWTEENFDASACACTFVTAAHPKAPWEDMHLMSLCRHHIIANSTFSWWGAWLAPESELVCVPAQWFAQHPGAPGDLAPSHWNIIQN